MKMSFRTQSDYDNRALASRAIKRSRVAAASLWLVAAAAAGLAVYTFLPLLKPTPVETDPAAALAPSHPKQAIAYEGEISGVDKNQKPFTIKADKGLQDQQQKNVVHLDKIEGQFKDAKGAALDVASQQGQYDSKSKVLVLDGEVVIRDDKGMTARMGKAEFNTETKALESKTPVQVEMTNGTVAADALTADNDGERLLFKGRVKATIGSSQ
jgi:lipopolysaccharide export system protein LptC